MWFDLQIARDQPDLHKAFTTVLNVLDMSVARSLPDVGSYDELAVASGAPDRPSWRMRRNTDASVVPHDAVW